MTPRPWSSAGKLSRRSHQTSPSMETVKGLNENHIFLDAVASQALDRFTGSLTKFKRPHWLPHAYYIPAILIAVE